jgi:hypothetical protein
MPLPIPLRAVESDGHNPERLLIVAPLFLDDGDKLFAGDQSITGDWSVNGKAEPVFTAKSTVSRFWE